MGGCCTSFEVLRDRPSKDVYTGLKGSQLKLRKRNRRFFYDVIFDNRPLHITITAGKKDKDGYITAMDSICPVPKEMIAINSKVVCVNSILVEGSSIREIGTLLTTQPLPLRLTMVNPDGLHPDEGPNLEPYVTPHAQTPSQ